MGTHPTTRLVEFFTDNANEYYSKPMQAFYNEHGIQYNTTIPYTPEQNSISERIKPNPLRQSARRPPLMALTPPPPLPQFWDAALIDITNKYNKTTHSTIGKTPFEAWYSTKPNVGNMLPFGCYRYVAEVTGTKKKLQPRAKLCRYMYQQDDQHYVVYDQQKQHTKDAASVIPPILP